jgi:predicted house-cleaning noncanonical NTP pyrophosphatase (MazG superfamily)
MQEHHKLVRDKVPEHIRSKGEQAVVRQLKDAEFRRALLKKMVEEALELAAASGRSAVLQELADVKDVYDAILREHKFTDGDVQFAQKRKERESGGFTRGYFLETTERAA